MLVKNHLVPPTLRSEDRIGCPIYLSDERSRFRAVICPNEGLPSGKGSAVVCRPPGRRRLVAYVSPVGLEMVRRQAQHARLNVNVPDDSTVLVRSGVLWVAAAQTLHLATWIVVGGCKEGRRCRGRWRRRHGSCRGRTLATADVVRSVEAAVLARSLLRQLHAARNLQRALHFGEPRAQRLALLRQCHAVAFGVPHAPLEIRGTLLQRPVLRS
mmetsp:Transcript_22670/g.63233  ORF Transcript_22670/g.63233 Transcript_22670/m.63233 type:complete len:213 (-) Transcript_22670:518-1156(-)